MTSQRYNKHLKESLRLCSRNNCNEQCLHYSYVGFPSCMRLLMDDALELIETQEKQKQRQKNKIKRMKGESEDVSTAQTDP